MSNEHGRLDAPPEALDDDPVITGLMTRNIVAIVPEATVMTALQIMAASGVRHLPVFTGPLCIGLLLETDALHGELVTANPRLTVRDVYRIAPTVSPTDRRSTAAQRMHDAAIDAALVTDGNRLLGIVTATDLIRSLTPHTRAADAPTGPDPFEGPPTRAVGDNRP
jgi:CBS domain-containing protein